MMAVRVFTFLVFFSLSFCCKPRADEWVFRGGSAAGIIKDNNAERGHRSLETRPVESFWRRADEDVSVREKFGKGLFEQIKTSAGVLTAYMYGEVDFRLYLDAKELARGVDMRLVQVYPEEWKSPSIILVHVFPVSKPEYDPLNVFERLYLVDVSVSPPFISKDYMPIMTGSEAFGGHGYGIAVHPKIAKKSDSAYIISSLSWREQGKDGKPLPVSYLYNRKDGTLTPVK